VAGLVEVLEICAKLHQQFVWRPVTHGNKLLHKIRCSGVNSFFRINRRPGAGSK
jgi:hypothetical protein